MLINFFMKNIERPFMSSDFLHCNWVVASTISVTVTGLAEKLKGIGLTKNTSGSVSEGGILLQ